MIVLDTNSLIRYFTNDDVGKADKVQALLEHEEVLVPDVVFPELEYVLMGGMYKLSKDSMILLFEFLISKSNILVSNEVRMALEIFKSRNLDMADCVIASCSLGHKLASFDKKLLRVNRISSYW